MQYVYTLANNSQKIFKIVNPLFGEPNVCHYQTLRNTVLYLILYILIIIIIFLIFILIFNR